LADRPEKVLNAPPHKGQEHSATRSAPFMAAGGIKLKLVAMAQYLVERRLMDVSRRLRKTREELAIADEQLMALAEAADEARLRSLVSETPLAAKEIQEAQRHADAMAGARDGLASQVKRLEHELDELLDKLVPGNAG
jgi:chromosome segregation ATPase